MDASNTTFLEDELEDPAVRLASLAATRLVVSIDGLDGVLLDVPVTVLDALATLTDDLLTVIGVDAGDRPGLSAMAPFAIEHPAGRTLRIRVEKADH